MDNLLYLVNTREIYRNLAISEIFVSFLSRKRHEYLKVFSQNFWIKESSSSSQKEKAKTVIRKSEIHPLKVTALIIRFFIIDFFTKFDQIRRKQRILSNLLKKSLRGNIISCTVNVSILYESLFT